MALFKKAITGESDILLPRLFNSADCNRLNDHTLETEEQDDSWNHCNNGGCHNQGVIALNGIIGIKGADYNLKRPGLFTP